eukprot:2528523-Heterocapsa_arctica.AAC.1
MQICVLSMRHEPSARQRHHVMNAGFVVDGQKYVLRGSFQHLHCRVELGSSRRLLDARHYVVAV